MKKKTKIVCTIGPSSWEEKPLREMIVAGMNIARVNGAFADVTEMARVSKLVRSISDEVALMIDIKGHEVRLNRFAETILVQSGDEIIIGNSKEDGIYPATYPNIYKEVEEGQLIHVDKGETTLKVEKIRDGKLFCRVVRGSEIKPGKGLNLPGAKLKNPAVTENDIVQMNFAIEDNWDFVASFVRNAEDVKTIRSHFKDSSIGLISKIEDQQGVDNIDEILALSDGIMVARGDMGTEIPIERLPILQKEIIYKCNRAAKPVITATNMLESMIEKPFPTRAEVTDVANAVLDGTDAIMTSGETSSGKYPVEVVDTMSRISAENEKYLIPEILEDLQLENKIISVAIANAAFNVVMELGIKKIVVVSESGSLPKLLSRLNMPATIIALVNNSTTQRQIGALSKGVQAEVFKQEFDDRDNAVNGMLKYILDKKLVKKNDKILFVGNTTNTSKLKSQYPNIFEYLDLATANIHS